MRTRDDAYWLKSESVEWEVGGGVGGVLASMSARLLGKHKLVEKVQMKG
jgi:hypothetical protein